MKWKIPEVNESCFKRRAVLSGIMKSGPFLILPVLMWITPLTSISKLYTLSAPQSLRATPAVRSTLEASYYLCSGDPQFTYNGSKAVPILLLEYIVKIVLLIVSYYC